MSQTWKNLWVSLLQLTQSVNSLVIILRTVTQVHNSTWMNKCLGDSMNFLLMNMGVISRSLGEIDMLRWFRPEAHSVQGCWITMQHKVRSFSVIFQLKSPLQSEWAVGEGGIRYPKPPLQPHQTRTGNPPRDAMGRWCHSESGRKPSERHSDGSLWCRGILNCKLRWLNLIIGLFRQQELESYDLGDMVPAIGGYLGLFIGFSCLGFFDFVCQSVGTMYIAIKSNDE